ncbi:hypothetical protein, partial [Caulobacter sp.]|uniref:hypothetical protein n=1 Tax=Caulobacter sp. TaxID=78 RepID=UPI003BB09E27
MPALTCLALVAAIALQLALPGGDMPAEAAGLAPRRSRPLVATPTPDYAAILAAPVFSPDRINHDNAPGGGNGGVTSGALTLVGVTTGGRFPSAVLRAADGATAVARPGQTFAGWRVTSVGPGAVRLSGAAGRVTLRVADSASPTNAQPGV